MPRPRKRPEVTGFETEAETKAAKETGSELDIIIADIQKKKGGNMIRRASAMPLFNTISTGTFIIDFALMGGIPEGLAYMPYGYESCLLWNTNIRFQGYDPRGKMTDCKGGTIQSLYNRFHKLTPRRLGKETETLYVMSVDEDGGVFRNAIVDVVKTGSKPCYRVTTDTGHSLCATMEHKFLTPKGYKALAKLSPGDEVMLHLRTGRGKADRPTRPTVMVKYHPRWKTKAIFDKKTGNTYVYHRGPRSHAALEAQLNGMTYDDYILFLNTASIGQIKSVKTISDGHHIHHEDGNFLNDSPDNLTILTATEHGLRHAEDCSKNTRYVATAHAIKTIEFDRQDLTFDIKCAYPYNNYIADKFVVHNSGKTTHTMRIVAAMQRKYPDRTVVWLDPELTFDKGWAEKQGIDIEALYMVEPTSGEEAVDILSVLLDTLEVSMVVVDSIPAMIPMAVDEESAEQQFMAIHPRLIGRMCSKILLSWSKERKRDHWVTVVLTNQWRSKMVLMGDPRSLPGGYQLGHLVTTRVELKNKPELGKDAFDTEIVEKNVHSFTVGKAKIGASIRHGEFEMTVNPDHPLGPGVFMEAKTVCVYAKRFGLITGGGGSWHILDVERKFRKLEEMEAFLYEEDAEFLRLKQRIIAKQRVDKGLPALPPDKYLLDWNAEENLAGFIE